MSLQTAVDPATCPAAFDDASVALLHELVAVRSESGDEGAAARLLVAHMAAAGLAARLDAVGNAVGEVVFGSGRRHLMLLGHIDTVPGGPAVELRDGKLYGRGAVDAKGPLVTFVRAAARLAQDPSSASLDLRLTVVGAVEEEVSSSKGARHVAGLYRPDACVIGEPSGADAVTLAYKGRLLVDLERRLPTAHSAGPEPTASASAVADWNAVEAWAAAWNEGLQGVFPSLQTELQGIHGGREGDEDVCRAVLGFRLPPALDPHAFEATLRDLWGEPELGRRELRFRGHEEAWVSERSHDLARAFSAAVRQVSGARPRLKHKTGTSDMNVVAPVWRCPILAYGPGDSALDHTPWEHLELAEFLQAIDVLEAAIRRWAVLGRVGG